jgi:hypothetical protein
MNLSPRWGEESWRRTGGYKYHTPPGEAESADRLDLFPVGCDFCCAVVLCGPFTLSLLSASLRLFQDRCLCAQVDQVPALEGIDCFARHQSNISCLNVESFR